MSSLTSLNESRKSTRPNSSLFEYLFIIVVKKNYDGILPDELSVFEDQVLYVLDELETTYLCYAPQTKDTGTVRKSNTEKQKVYVALAGIVINDQISNDPAEMTCFKDDKIVIVARCLDGYVYCKRTGTKTNQGKVLIEKLFIEGDTNTLPTYKEYSERSSNTTIAKGSPSTPRLRRLNENDETNSPQTMSLERVWNTVKERKPSGAGTIAKAIEKLNNPNKK